MNNLLFSWFIPLLLSVSDSRYVQLFFLKYNETEDQVTEATTFYLPVGVAIACDKYGMCFSLLWQSKISDKFDNPDLLIIY